MKYDSVISLLSAQIGLIKGIIFLLVLGLFLNGCYSNKSILLPSDSQESLDKINRGVNEKTVQIQLMNGESFAGKAVRVTMDSTYWWDAKTKTTKYSTATSEIGSISTRKRNTLKGLGYGFLIGAATGAVLAAVINGQTNGGDFDCNDPDGTICITRSGLVILSTLSFGSVFGVIGLISGIATKTTESYELEQREPEP